MWSAFCSWLRRYAKWQSGETGGAGLDHRQTRFGGTVAFAWDARCLFYVLISCIVQTCFEARCGAKGDYEGL